ncbi:MAG: protein kinase, partial [Bryobacterales bacterium]
MSTELWQRAREVFAEVAELPAERRVDALRERSAGDADVRAAAAELLEKYEKQAAGPTLLSSGEVIDKRFRVRRLVGRGGMGEVYLCDDIALGEQVALKALRADTGAGADAAARFRREIQLARRVTHPNVCRVFELGRHTGSKGPIDYYTMEYVDGETLADLLARRGALDVEEARPLIEQVAAGLGALHDREIVHRDLKPGNILIERRGADGMRVVLTDFGIAGSTGRRAELDSFATGGGQILGTPEYMAPEQLSGLAAGPATDLFALGAVLYETLTGQRPFPDPNQRIRTPIGPRTFNPEIPLSWELIILDCLQPDMTRRPQSVGELLEALGGMAQPRLPDPSTAQTVAVPRPAPPHSASPWKRWGVVAALVALVALAALTMLGWRDGGAPLPAFAEGRRVAVLPFLTASNDPALQALADGLMESITSRLSQYESRNAELLVVPASEVRKVGVLHAANARGALGANYALEGRLTEQGERIRLILTLIDTERMVQADTAVINGARARALDLEDEAVTRVATLLNLHALPEQVESIASVAPGAQEFYLQGTGYLQRSDEVDSVQNAIQLFEKSISLDENYAMAYAGLSKAYLDMRARTLEPEWVLKADKASLRAVELRPDLLETQTARGAALVAQGRFDEAIEVFNTALERNPRSEEAYAGLGQAYEQMASRATDSAEKQTMQDQAEAAFRKAVSLRPNDWV